MFCSIAQSFAPPPLPCSIHKFGFLTRHLQAATSFQQPEQVVLLSNRLTADHKLTGKEQGVAKMYAR